VALLDTVEPVELPAGSQLGNYVIQALIGRGAMASVYRAEHALLNKPVALKVMASALHGSSEARQRFLREARAVAAIEHPNVVSISDAGLFEGTPYLVMELLDGEDLEQHLRQHGPFSASELPALALPIVAALAAAHDIGVIHRDLKPGNIFLGRGSDGELVPKLLDFGISKFDGTVAPPTLAVTAFDQLLGSPLYLPPEALQGSRELTARSDQYSLGVVLYECITGQAPFYRDDLVPLLNAICEGTCPLPRQLRPDTPAALEHAILRAMSVDPRQRFGHIRELGRALLELADPLTRERWSAAFASAALVVATPSTSVVVTPQAPLLAPAEPARVAARAAAGSRPRRRLWAAWALLATGCLLLALALVRTREMNLRPQPSLAPPEPAAAADGRRDAPDVLRPPAPAIRAVSERALGAVVSTPAASVSAGTARAAASPRVFTTPGTPAAGEKRRPAAKRGSELESARELSQMFFPEPAGERVPATRRESRPAPVLVNEAPLFD
jgi:serine/threonine-protein kinase